MSDGTSCGMDLTCLLINDGYSEADRDDHLFDKDEIVKDLKLDKPLDGFHIGLSGNLGIVFEDYGYVQGDLLFDRSTGKFYWMSTYGGGHYIGTPNGVSGDVYFGTSSVYGIPLYAPQDQVAELLGGDNIDVAVEVGLDAAVEVAGTIGASLDLNPNTGDYQYTAAGQMFTVEKSVIFGGGAIPTSLDAGVEFGKSHSEAGFLYEIPWWPDFWWPDTLP